MRMLTVVGEMNPTVIEPYLLGQLMDRDALPIAIVPVATKDTEVTPTEPELVEMSMLCEQPFIEESTRLYPMYLIGYGGSQIPVFGGLILLWNGKTQTYSATIELIHF